MTILSLIVAAADNNVIGIDNKMPWHIPEDFKYFKSVTMGKPCIMGRKTYESILAQLGKPLPGRTSIVISRNGYSHEGAITAATLDEAIDKASAETNDEIMVIGGAQIYALALYKADRIYLTRVHQHPEGDAFFPELGEEWKQIEGTDHDGFSFLIFERA
ncbi:MAG TPA: dihydrofolate reductase [Alphaproteobacteria bacterium]|nr:dihydrofolate reductase [Alphaproteobacteria bacterium]